MIKKVYEVDPLLSFLTDWVVVDCILLRPQLSFMAERPPPPLEIQKNIELEVSPADII